jgi:hypothetical protein
MGWRSHSGWAVLVVVREPISSPSVIVRRRVELVDESVPRQPYHAIVDGRLSMPAASSLIARVEKMSAAAALASTQTAVREFAVEAVGVVGRRRHIPDDLEQILSSHAMLHAAEGYLFERALIEAAAQAGVPVSLLEPELLAVGDALEASGKVLGPPWQKDHKLAAAAALAALNQ